MANKLLFCENNYTYYLDLVKQSGLPYAVEQTNYTLKIISDFVNVYFMQNVMSMQSFAAFAKIKSDIKKQGLVPPQIIKSDLDYYNFNATEIIRKSPSTIYNVDLKSAYANVLKNMGVISEPTFLYLSKLNKKDRLAAVGMLASCKYVFLYNKNSEPYQFKKIENDLTGFFYLCVLEVQKIMSELKQRIGSNYLFYWVDGIYFYGDLPKKRVTDYLDEIKYPYSFDVLNNFSVVDTEKESRIYFEKTGEKKYFSIPKPDDKLKKDVINAMIPKKINKLAKK